MFNSLSSEKNILEGLPGSGALAIFLQHTSVQHRTSLKLIAIFLSAVKTRNFKCIGRLKMEIKFEF